MHSWSCPHIPWQLSLILFSWSSIQRLPLLSLQEACTLFQYLLWAIHTDTFSMSEHIAQSSEAVSMSESSMCSSAKSESDEAWSPVLCELSAALPPSETAMDLDGLEGGQVVSYSCCSELGPACSISPGMFPSPHVELWPLPVLTSFESTWVHLLWWWSSELLESGPIFFARKWLRPWQMVTPQGECP